MFRWVVTEWSRVETARTVLTEYRRFPTVTTDRSLVCHRWTETVQRESDGRRRRLDDGVSTRTTHESRPVHLSCGVISCQRVLEVHEECRTSDWERCGEVLVLVHRPRVHTPSKEV